ncbi:hypothetical protein TVAG_452030 [Trichomonas vaginalis G3]|uniref:Mannosyltransferase n=1 Tax=Trichomonas vaginalis (strain ATCC PRA-98 / G3) TaxID=412133 RepID=A2DJS5_TRIV3|nr:hypothetical protein TVAGG3_0290030 [Trichomonas vaginalis G3]EAY19289.1 hypothetical protein TVAG_452030 [Trichomonas vaginalis G3]KAI5527191.1 hypothetical protein TVAGG3_0290030 [Trichomonas vaginalis G3]|eukprot:XP_001580275.1 hypothetical protein [Trichomonas vaginalis G3]
MNKRSDVLSGVRNPFYLNSTITSEYITTFYAALMKVGGVPVTFSIQIQTFFLFMSVYILQFSFTYRITGNKFASLLSSLAVILPGGFGFMEWPIYQVRNQKNVDYINIISKNHSIFWGHPLVHCLLISRTSTLSLSLAIFTYILLESKLDIFAGISLMMSSITRPQNGFILMFFYLVYCSDFKKVLNNIWLGPSFKMRIKTQLNEYYVRIIMAILNFLIYFMTNIDFQKSSSMWSKSSSNSSAVPFISFFISCYGLHFFGFISSCNLKRSINFIMTLSLYYFCGWFTFQSLHRNNFAIVFSILSPIIISYSFASYGRFYNRLKNKELIGIYDAFLLFIFIIGATSAILGFENRKKVTIVRSTDNETDLVEWVVENTSRFDVFYNKFPMRWNPVVTKAGRQLFYGDDNMMPYLIENFEKNKDMVQTIYYKNFTYSDIDYFIYVTSDKDGKDIKNNHRKILKLVYENDKYFIFKNIVKHKDD